MQDISNTSDYVKRIKEALAREGFDSEMDVKMLVHDYAEIEIRVLGNMSTEDLRAFILNKVRP
jgi:DNA polymerase I-like protein with 3'-5' exonuclease and polymerase domains